MFNFGFGGFPGMGGHGGPGGPMEEDSEPVDTERYYKVWLRTCERLR